MFVRIPTSSFLFWVRVRVYSYVHFVCATMRTLHVMPRLVVLASEFGKPRSTGMR